MLVIEHDMPLVTKLADRMMALDQGRVIVEGIPDDVINHHAVVESYLGAEGYSDLVADGRKRRSRKSTRRKTTTRR
jgi:ABC-type hemin transport system ATPase subunit